jgi:carboxypeptidase family protein
MRSIFRLVLWICVVQSSAGALWADCPLQIIGACSPFPLHAATFLGKVLSVREIDYGRGASGSVYRFQVLESFAGDQKRGGEVDVGLIFGGAASLIVGQNYLVDAFDAGPGEPVRLLTGECSLTALEEESADALLNLRQRASGERLPDLSGVFTTVESEGNRLPGDTKPLPDIKVTLTSERDGSTYSAVTDSSGIYVFPQLKPETYRIDFDLPPKRAIPYRDSSKPIQVSIPDKGDAGAGCHRSFAAAPTGEIAGQIVNAAGTGVKGFVAAYPSDKEDISNWQLNVVESGGTDDQGRFRLRYLRDGEYRLEFSVAGRMQDEHVAEAAVRDGQGTTVKLVVPQ